MIDDASTLIYRLALNRLPSLSRAEKIEILRNPQKRKQLKKLETFCRDRSLVEAALRQAEIDERVLGRFGIRTLWFADPDYPPLLAEISDPPLVLFVRGEFRSDDFPPLAIVGTRRPSPAGVREARRFGREAAQFGCPCISGLALGIDAWAHRGVLDAGGRAIAVLGHGIDMIYPPSNRELARSILDSGGALVSEYAPGIAPWKWNFPARNRIISGLSRAVLVVQAPLSSGALITADFALDQNRDLWVSRRVIEESRETSAGTCRLLEQGAPALDTIAEIIVDWADVGIVRNDLSYPFFEEEGPVDISGEQSLLSSDTGARLARDLVETFDRRESRGGPVKGRDKNAT